MPVTTDNPREDALRVARSNAQCALDFRRDFDSLECSIDSHRQNVADTLSDTPMAEHLDQALAEFDREIQRLTGTMTSAQRLAIDQLREAGFAVIIWTPAELRGVAPKYVVDASIEHGHAVIDNLSDQPAPDESDEPEAAAQLRCPECGEPVHDIPVGSALPKCWNSAGHASGAPLAFDTTD